MSAVEWPQQRGDVANALRILATISTATMDAWPGFTEAVHWLIDDTFWDEREPGTSVGTILRDPSEAEAVLAVVTPLLAVLDQLGPDRPDQDYLLHPGWPDVTDAAARALDRLGESDHPHPGR